jgi:hypothetical protein
MTTAHQIAAAILRELSYPNSTWHREFPTATRLAALFRADIGTVGRGLALLGEQHLLVQRSTRTPSGHISRVLRWQPPVADARYSATELALKLSHAILNGGLRELPRAPALAALYRTDLDTVKEAMTMLCTRSLVTAVPNPTPDSLVGWSVTHNSGHNPGTVASPDVHTVVHELTRRIGTGWYRYMALDGTWYTRPFPTPMQVCAQLHCAPSVALIALRHLSLAGLIAPPTSSLATTSAPNQARPVRTPPSHPPAATQTRAPTPSALTRQYTVTAPNAVLCGGNLTALPQQHRYVRVDDTSQKIKILVGNGYDHFLPTDRVQRSYGHILTVYDWSHRTYIAE